MVDYCLLVAGIVFSNGAVTELLVHQGYSVEVVDISAAGIIYSVRNDLLVADKAWRRVDEAASFPFKDMMLEMCIAVLDWPQTWQTYKGCWESG